MPETEALTTISPAALAGLVVAYLMAASRIAGPLAPLWARLPSPWPQLAPAIMALLPQVADLFKDANTWQSFAVSVTSAIALILPGITPKPPEPPSDKPVGPWVDIDTEKTPPSLPGVRMVGLALVIIGCSSSPKLEPRGPNDPCTPAQHEREKRAYQADVHLHCATYDVVDECPHYLPLKDKFDKKIEAGCAP